MRLISHSYSRLYFIYTNSAHHISVEQGSWSESLQQEVIWLADFKTYATSFQLSTVFR